MRSAILFASVLPALVLLAAFASIARADPDALWKIVDGACVPDQVQHGDPKPCAEVALGDGVARGYALLKDRNGATQFLLLPTARVAGIESPAILAPGAANYFAAAWRARSHLDALAHRTPARDEVALAVNSTAGRTQNQLHIHIDCLRADVREALSRRGNEIGDDWAPFPLPLAGHPYWAMRLAGEALAANPFALLAEKRAGAKAAMGDQTLVVVGAVLADGRPGFFLLNDHIGATLADRASGEELQDHEAACKRARMR